MTPTRRQNESGVALIIVMVAVIVLTALAGGFAYSMKVETKLAMNANNDTELEWMGRSGVEVARYALGLQMAIASEPYDSLNQVWAGGTGGAGTSNSPLASLQMKDIPLGNGTVSVDSIIDLERKANINSASAELLEQALVLTGSDAGNYPAIAGAILDWIDPDDTTHTEGAESDYYESLEFPYQAKNGPMDDISELLLVRGITSELYWGEKSTNHAPSRVQPDAQRRLGFQANSVGYAVGLEELFTALSSGRININTASATVLQMIPFVDERAAAEIVRLRGGPGGGEEDIPFRNVGELVNAGLPNQAVQQATRYCDVRSRTFEVKITAEINNSRRSFKAVVARNTPRDIQILSFRSE